MFHEVAKMWLDVLTVNWIPHLDISNILLAIIFSQCIFTKLALRVHESPLHQRKKTQLMRDRSLGTSSDYFFQTNSSAWLIIRQVVMEWLVA